MKILITGATGVIGRRAVPALVRAGHEVRAVARTPEKAESITSAGAQPTTVDLFNAEQVAEAVAGRDAVIHLATSIPIGASAARRSAWKMNDRLRTEAASNLASAVIDAGTARYIGESITFPYLDAGSEWIDESHQRVYHAGTQTVTQAEAAAQRVADHGSAGVILRFAMFHATDSDHIRTFLTMAKRGISPFVGAPGNYQSFIDVGDASRAVVAALEVPSGTYNVAEPDPTTRAEHATELARVLGKKKLRFLPTILQKAGGAAAAEFSRSQRISSQAMQQASSWEPRVDVIQSWKDLA